MKRNFVSLLSILVLGAFAATPAQAQSVQAQSVRPAIKAMSRFAVFPFENLGERGARVDSATADKLDEAWWQVREELADTGRFLVATKAFLQKADVFSPRGLLSSGDAVILGRYVEADGVMTFRLENRQLSLNVWDATDGALAWRSKADLHPSVLIRDQIGPVAKSMVREFIANIPYHGVTLKDQLARAAIFDEGGKKFARAHVGGQIRIDALTPAEKGVAGVRPVGDGKSDIAPGQAAGLATGLQVQWIKLQRVGLEPLFQGGAKPIIKAEGTIREINDRVAKIEIHRTLETSVIEEGALIVIPAEAQRLKQTGKVEAGGVDGAVLTLLAANDKAGALEPEGRRAEREKDETGALATTLSILGSLAVILLLAF